MAHVVVIGAGLGGLSAACHLTGRGYDVTVLERLDVPGGRTGLKQQDGYTMDTGPTVMTMKGILASTFAAAGADIKDFLQLQPVDPMYRATFPDGSTIHCRHGVQAMHQEIREQCGTHEARSFRQFCGWLTDLYQLEMPSFIDRNFNSPLDLANPPSPILQLIRLGGLRKLSNVVNSYFRDERLQRLFSFQAMYAGLSPFTALAIYAVITYMDSVEGVYFPDGGMHSVPTALATAAEKCGVQFRYGTEVDEVIRNSGKVAGVRIANGETVRADAVVVNADLPVAYRSLFPDVPMPRVAAKGSYSPSCLVWLAGVKGALPTGTAHHNIHFGGQWKEAFDALLEHGRPMPDPSILVTSPTVSDATLAPADRHSLYVLEPMPNLDGNIDWHREGSAIKARLTEKVAALGYPTDIEVQEMIGPLEWQAKGMERGTPFALSHKFLQTGPFRPANTDKRIPGAVFVGSGTTPGVGIPMVLTSGRLAADRVDEYVSQAS
jgi:phytoene desaturase